MTPPLPGPDEGLNAAVAAELRAEQGRQRMSVQALSEKSGIPYGSLRRYLGAERHIDVTVLDQIARALGVSARDVVLSGVARLEDETSVEEYYEDIAAHESAGTIESEQEAPDTP